MVLRRVANLTTRESANEGTSCYNPLRWEKDDTEIKFDISNRTYSERIRLLERKAEFHFRVAV